MEISWIHTNTEFAALEAAWQKLFENIGSDNPFASFDWNYCWWQYFSEPNWELEICLLIEKSELIGIVPLYKKQVLGLAHSYELLGTGRSDFPDFLIAADKREFLCEQLANSLADKMGRWDILNLHEVNEHQGAFKQVCDVFTASTFAVFSRQKEVAPYIEFKGEKWEDFLQTKGKKFRKAMIKKEKRLLNKGPVEINKFNCYEVKTGLSQNAFDLASSIERQSWKFTNGSERINTNKNSKAWFNDLLQRFAGRGWLDFWVYSLDTAPKAYAVNFNIGGRISAYNSAYCEDVAENGPGALMHIYRIRDACESEAKRYSFLRGKESYKFEWTKEVESLHQVILTKSSLNPIALYNLFRWKLAGSIFIKRKREQFLNFLHKLKRK